MIAELTPNGTPGIPLTNGSYKPASFLRYRTGPSKEIDPASNMPGMPPGMGQDMLPHVVTFQGTLSSASRVYRPSDEAIKYSRDNARFMLNDPIIRECLDQRRRSVALLNWHIEPPDPKDQRQLELVGRLTKDMEGIKRFMQYRESLQMAIWTGRSANTHKWGWRFIDGKRRAIPTWLPLHGDKLVFRYDDGRQEYDADQIGIRVGAGFIGADSLQSRLRYRDDKVQPTDYGLAYFLDKWERCQLAVHKHMIEDGEYEDPQGAGRIHGLGIRSIIFWTWMQKQEALAWMMEYLERSAFGIEMWYYPWGNQKAREAALVAARDRIGDGRNILLVPRMQGDEQGVYGVERIEPGLGGVEALKEIITDYFGHQIKRYFLGQTMTTEAHATGIGSNLPAIQLDTYLQIIKYDSINHEETITDELLTHLIRFNEPWAIGIPLKFRVDTEEDESEEKLAAFKSAYDMGLKIKASDIYDILGASAPDQDDETLQMPQQGAGMEGAGALGQQPGVYGQAGQEAPPLNLDPEADVKQIAAALGVAESENSEREKLSRYGKSWNPSDHPRDEEGKFTGGPGTEAAPRKAHADDDTRTNKGTATEAPPRKPPARLLKGITATEEHPRTKQHPDDDDREVPGTQPDLAGGVKPRALITPQKKAEIIHQEKFKSWFGDWAGNAAGASKVVNDDGEPAETYDYKPPTVVYHGTSAGDFDRFEPAKAAADSLYGPGFYFTEDRGIAEEYTYKGEEGQQVAEDDDRRTILECFLNIRKPFDLEQDKISAKELGLKRYFSGSVRDDDDADENTPFDFEYWRDYAEETWELGDKIEDINGDKKLANVAKFITDGIKRLGYDGMTHTGGRNIGTRDHKVWIAFEPTQVKAALNTGSWDSADPRLKYAYDESKHPRADDGKFGSGGGHQSALFETEDQKSLFGSETQEEKNRKEPKDEPAAEPKVFRTTAEINAALLAEWKGREAQRVAANRRAMAEVPAGLRNWKNSGPSKTSGVKQPGSLAGQQTMFEREGEPPAQDVNPFQRLLASEFSKRGFTKAGVA